MNKVILERGPARIEYRSAGCSYHYTCHGLSGPVIEVDINGYTVGHWHTRRFWGRNRTTTECVALALQCILEWEGEQKRAQQEAEIAAEEAEALAEFAREIALP